MAAASRGSTSSPPNDIRTEFKTKEGIYKNLGRNYTYSKSRKETLAGKELSPTKVTIVRTSDMQGQREFIILNSGRELYCFRFYGTEQGSQLSECVDKHSYRSSYPLVHSVNQCTRSSTNLDLVVGFNGGPIQHLNPISQAAKGVYNGDHQVDSSNVTCLQWIPGSDNHFISAHLSGNLYEWTTEHSYKNSPPTNFIPHKEIADTTIYSCKAKGKSPLLFRWAIGHGPITAFAFSPDTKHLAVVSRDGFLRVYDFEKQTLYGKMRSYFGGLSCVCWSPDGKYVVTGGEDDLISVWSFEYQRVVTRGEGHISYVNAVAFDPYISDANLPQPSAISSATADLSSTSTSDLISQRSSRYFLEEDVSYRLGSVGLDGRLCLWELSGDALTIRKLHGRPRSFAGIRQGGTLTGDPRKEKTEVSSGDEKDKTQSQPEKESDVRTQNSSEGLLSDLGDASDIQNDVNHQDPQRQRRAVSESISAQEGSITSQTSTSQTSTKSLEKKKKKHGKKERLKEKDTSDPSSMELLSPLEGDAFKPGNAANSTDSSSVASSGSKGKLKSKKTKVLDGVHKEKVSKRSSLSRKAKGIVTPPISTQRRCVNNHFESCRSDDIALKMDEVNLVEPLVSKKICQERLTDIVFREECLLTAGCDGLVSVWSRPGREPQEEEHVERLNDSPHPPGLNSPRPGGQDVKQTTI